MYYDNEFLPHLFLDGFIDASNDPGDDTWFNMVTDRAQVESPLEMNLEIDFDGSGGTVYAHITAEEAITQSDPVIHFVLTESEIEHEAPNGISLHHNIMRKMLPDEKGESFTIQAGQSLNLSREFILQPEWVPESCAFVVFIQDNVTGEVLQAARSRIFTSISMMTYSLTEPDGDGDGNFEPGETVHLFLSLMNFGPLATDVSVLLTCDDPDISLLTSGIQFEDIPLNTTMDNSAFPLIFQIDQSVGAHYTTLTAEVTANGGQVSFQESIEILVGKPEILIVNDDHLPPPYSWDYDAEGLYRRALDDRGETYHVWNTQVSGTPEGYLLQEYEIVIWFTSVSDFTLNTEDEAALTSFLDSGGRLIISGEDIGADLASSDFLSEYLHAQLMSDNSSNPILSGVQGDVISGNVSFMSINGIEGVNNRPDVIGPLSGATPFFTYGVSGEPAAIRYGGDYKVVYFAFGFEGILDFYNAENSSTLRADLMQNTLNWLRQEFTPQVGDVNEDSAVDILDVLWVVNIVLGIDVPTSGQEWAADCNGDGGIDILDALGIINVILGTGACSSTTVKPTLTFEVMQFCQSLKSYLSHEEFDRFMTLIKGNAQVPVEFHLAQNYPNPFNTNTEIKFQIPVETSMPHVTLIVYNLLGQEIKTLVNGLKEPGVHTVTWDGKDNFGSGVSSGMYFYRFKVGKFMAMRRMILLK